MDAPRYASLRDYMAAIRRSALLIVASALVAGAVAYLVASRPATRYQATASVLYEDPTRDLAYIGGSVSDTTPADSSAAVQARRITSPPVLFAAERSLGGHPSAAELAQDIEVSIAADSPLVSVTFTSDDPAVAVRGANAVVRAAQSATNADARARLEQLATRIRSRLRALSDGATGQALRPQLAQQLAVVGYLAASARPAQTTFLAAGSVRDAPARLRTTAIGIALGLVVGLIVALLRDGFDKRLHGAGSFQRELGLPLVGGVGSAALGRVLWPADASDRRLARDVESFQIMRQNVEHLAELPPRTLLVTSTVPDEGASTVAASLAAAAGASKRAVLVECDLRRPALAERLSLARSPGLAEHLAGDATAANVLQAAWSTPGGAGDAPAQRFDCITAGTPVQGGLPLLGSPRFGQLLRELLATYDLVVLDASPLLPVADTLEILPLADSIVLCVRSGRTTREQALAGRAILGHYPHRPVGVVVTGLRSREQPAYGQDLATLPA